MKKIEAVIKPFKLDEVKEALVAVGATDLTVVEAKGFNRKSDRPTDWFRAAEYVVDFLPKIQIEVVVPDQLAEQATEAIINAAGTGRIGDGKIWINNIEQCILIRTGERSTSTTLEC